MPERKYPAGSVYRYGFNGKENDNEVKGQGNQQDYGMRIYDPRLGRFLSEDPITKQYPELTPYQFASNRPTDGIDQDGLEFLSSFKSTQQNNFSATIYLQNAPPKIKEPEILVADIYGNGHIGPQSVVKQNVAAIEKNHYDAVANNIAGGFFGAAGYMVAGDKGSFYGAAIDGVAMSFGGISAGKSSVFPESVENSTEVELSPLGSLIQIKPNPAEIITITVPKNKYPESAEHIEDAIKSGVTPSGVINRNNANLQRRTNLKGIPTKKGRDRDEFPPAVVTPAGKVSVKYIDPSDNRGSGSHIGRQIKGLSNGTKICFRVTQ